MRQETRLPVAPTVGNMGNDTRLPGGQSRNGPGDIRRSLRCPDAAQASDGREPAVTGSGPLRIHDAIAICVRCPNVGQAIRHSGHGSRKPRPSPIGRPRASFDSLERQLLTGPSVDARGGSPS